MLTIKTTARSVSGKLIVCVKYSDKKANRNSLSSTISKTCTFQEVQKSISEIFSVTKAEKIVKVTFNGRPIEFSLN